MDDQTRVPASAAEDIALRFKFDQVVIVARNDGESEAHVRSFGRDSKNLGAAAWLGAFIRQQLARLASPRDMSAAPRDGTHILAYLYMAPDDVDYPGFGEWREIFYKPCDSGIAGWSLPWRAGDPFDSHSGDPPECMGENVPIAWLPLPERPAGAKLRRP